MRRGVILGNFPQDSRRPKPRCCSSSGSSGPGTGANAAAAPPSLFGDGVASSVLNLPFIRRKHRIDYLGAALLVGGVSSLLLVTVWGGQEYAWDSPTILFLAAIGVVLIGAFLVQERRTPEPILPLHLFQRSVFSVSAGISALVGLSMFGAAVFLPLYFQIVTGASATRSGLLMLPMVTGLMAASITSGRIISHRGRYRVFPIAGSFVMAIGLLLLSRLDVETPRWETAAYMLILGLGVGMTMQTLVLAVQNVVEHEDLGAATSGVNFFRSMGGAFGVALFGTILNDRLNYYVPRHVPADVLQSMGNPSGDALGRSRQVIELLPEVARVGVVQSFADSLDVVYLAAVPLAVLAFAVSWLLQDVPLREGVYIGAAMAEADYVPLDSDEDPAQAVQTIEREGQVNRSGFAYARRAGKRRPE